MLRSRPELLSLFLVVHLGNWFYGDASVSDVVESQVKSWEVERRSSSIDYFTVNMKPTFRCLAEWCGHRFNAAYGHKVGVNYGYCRCACEKPDSPGFPSFLPSMRRCINASMAASFAGCQEYFNNYTLLDTPVDLAAPRQNNDQTFKFQSRKSCELTASYFYDYEGFQSNWQRVDGFFSLDKNGTNFSVKWKQNTHQRLSGRIIRLNISCESTPSTSTRCFLFKALGSVIYNATSSGSSSSLLPSTSLSLSSSSLTSLSSTLSSSSSSSPSSSSTVSPVLSSLPLSLSSMSWLPSSSSLLQLTRSSVASSTSVKTSSSKMPLLKPTSSYSTSKMLTMPSMESSWLIKSSVTSISSTKLSQLRTSVETSSSEILPKKPTSSYSTSKTLTIPSTEPSWLIKSSVTSISSAKLSQLRTSVETSSSEILPKKPSTSSYSASKTLTIPSTEPSWLIKSSVTSISSAKLSQLRTSVETSSSEILPKKPTSSYSTSKTLTIPSTEPSWVTPTSTAAFIEPGGKEHQIKEKGWGVQIGAAVGSTLLAGAVFLILLICWRKQKARESTRKEKKQVEVGNPVYGISNNEFQMEKVKGSAQDGQQRYQDPSNTGQGVGATVYSNPDGNYDNYCAVYQSLEKPTPGSPVYQSLEEQIPESTVYESLNSDQDKPSGRAALKHVSPKQSTLQNPKSSASGQLNPTAKGLGFTPNPKERGSTERGIPNTYSTLTQKPTYKVRHEADAGQETTPGALYVDLEGPTSGQDYETLNGDDEYLAPTETNAQIGFESPCTRKDQVYVELEGPDAQKGPGEYEPSNAQEPLYNMLEDPNKGKSPKVEPSNSSFDPLYNVLEELDSDGSKKPEPVRGHYNPAYEQTLDFGHPYATPHRPGAQTESVYEPLRRASTLDP